MIVVKRFHQDEEGVSYIMLTIAMAIGLLALVGLFVAFWSQHAVRRVSQSGADAAALAAAEEYAQQLEWGPGAVHHSSPFDPFTMYGICPMTPEGVVQLYVSTQLMPIAYSSRGHGKAREYASRNRVRLRSVSGPRPSRNTSAYYHDLPGATLQSFEIETHVERDSPRPYGSGQAAVPARARAEFYVDRDHRPWLEQFICGFTPHGDPLFNYRLYIYWAVHLIRWQ